MTSCEHHKQLKKFSNIFASRLKKEDIVKFKETGDEETFRRLSHVLDEGVWQEFEKWKGELALFERGLENTAWNIIRNWNSSISRSLFYFNKDSKRVVLQGDVMMYNPAKAEYFPSCIEGVKGHVYCAAAHFDGLKRIGGKFAPRAFYFESAKRLEQVDKSIDLTQTNIKSDKDFIKAFPQLRKIGKDDIGISLYLNYKPQRKLRHAFQKMQKGTRIPSYHLPNIELEGKIWAKH